MNDKQRKRLYGWEDQFGAFGKRSETRAEIRKLINRASRRYSIDPPAVRFVSKENSPSLTVTTYYDSAAHVIQMGYRSCNAAISMHEVAHAVIAEYHETAQDHGPEFLGVYLDLLEWANVAPRSALHASARAKRLRWTPARRAQKKAS
jgi:hypothetical protein